MAPRNIAVKPVLADNHRKVYVILQSLLAGETRTSSLFFGRTDSPSDFRFLDQVWVQWHGFIKKGWISVA